MLGPLLFLIYINDLVECYDPYCEIYLFADDAKLYIVNPDDNCSLQKGIDALQCWGTGLLWGYGLLRRGYILLCHTKVINLHVTEPAHVVQCVRHSDAMCSRA